MSKRGRTRALASKSSTNQTSSSDLPSIRGRGRVLRARSPTNQASSSVTPPIRGRGRVVCSTVWAGISLRFFFRLRFFSSTELTTLAQKPMSHRRESPTEGPEAHYSDFRELLDFFCVITGPFLRCLCLYKHKL